MNTNPWLTHDIETAFVHKLDLPFINKFNLTAKTEFKYEKSLRPEPYIGNISSKVMLLALNPGVSEADFETHKNEMYIELHKNNLHQIKSNTPFYYLNESLKCPGTNWWNKKLKWLISDSSREIVINSICCLQYIPYHSKSYKHSNIKIPTQEFTRNIVKNHVLKNLPIVCLRSYKYWKELVPELNNYKNIFFLKNPRNPTLSPANMTESNYFKLVEIINEI